MAHSAIRYQNNTQYIQDALLEGALRCIFITIDSKVLENPSKYGWLLQAMNNWWGDFENMPPGLKDVELDGWLINSERRSDFEEILNLSLESFNNEFVNEVMKFKHVLE